MGHLRTHAPAICVILITGVHVGLDNIFRRSRQGFGGDESFWAVWMAQLLAKYHGDVGFILAPDAAKAAGGAEALHSAIGGLGADHYGGTISVVGESNGAAALFTYMALSAAGGYAGDPRINKFVAIDAPTASDPVGWLEQQAVKTVWAQWDPTAAAALSAVYVHQHGTTGLYAWNAYDPVSGPMIGPWTLAPRAIIPDGKHLWNISDVHNALVFDPDAQLIDAAVA